jgi:uncharacterized membrane protein
MHEATAVTIIAMGLVTYATRASGGFLGRRIRIPQQLEGPLQVLPGAIFISLVAPAIASAGLVGAIAAGATVLTALRLRGNLTVPMAVGLLVYVALRHLPW